MRPPVLLLGRLFLKPGPLSTHPFTATAPRLIPSNSTANSLVRRRRRGLHFPWTSFPPPISSRFSGQHHRTVSKVNAAKTGCFMSSPSGRIGEGSNAWKALPRKKKHRGRKNAMRKIQTAEGHGSGKLPGVSSSIPRGFVAGDRVFVCLKDTGKEKYSDIASGSSVEWLDVGFNGVQWGDGDGGAWIHTESALLNEFAWGVLKMSSDRLEELYVRSVKLKRKNMKPFLLPVHVNRLITQRENGRRWKLDAELSLTARCHAKEEAVAGVVSLRRSCGEREAVVADVVADPRALCAEEELSNERTRLDMVKLRNAQEQAVNAVKTGAEKEALIHKHALEEKALADVRGDTLDQKLRHSDEEPKQARVHVGRLKAEILGRTVDREKADSFAAKFTRTFVIEGRITGCIDVGRYDNLPEDMKEMRRYVDDHTWDGDDSSGFITIWLAQAFEKMLELRSRGLG